MRLARTYEDFEIHVVDDDDKTTVCGVRVADRWEFGRETLYCQPCRAAVGDNAHDDGTSRTVQDGVMHRASLTVCYQRRPWGMITTTESNLTGHASCDLREAPRACLLGPDAGPINCLACLALGGMSCPGT